MNCKACQATLTKENVLRVIPGCLHIACTRCIQNLCYPFSIEAIKCPVCQSLIPKAGSRAIYPNNFPLYKEKQPVVHKAPFSKAKKAGGKISLKKRRSKQRSHEKVSICEIHQLPITYVCLSSICRNKIGCNACFPFQHPKCSNEQVIALRDQYLIAKFAASEFNRPQIKECFRTHIQKFLRQIEIETFNNFDYQVDLRLDEFEKVLKKVLNQTNFDTHHFDFARDSSDGEWVVKLREDTEFEEWATGHYLDLIRTLIIDIPKQLSKVFGTKAFQISGLDLKNKEALNRLLPRIRTLHKKVFFQSNLSAKLV